MELHHKYFVIEFLAEPYDNVDKYVCIPRSWITIQRSDDRRISVAYPSEKLFSTRQYAKNKAEPLQEWNCYCALVRFGTDDFGDAEEYIKKKSNEGGQRNGCSKKTKVDDKLVTFNSKQSIPNKRALEDPAPVIYDENITGKSPKLAKQAKQFSETPDKCNLIENSNEIEGALNKSSYLTEKIHNEKVSEVPSLKDVDKKMCLPSNMENKVSPDIEHQFKKLLEHSNQETCSKIYSNDSEHISRPSVIINSNIIIKKLTSTSTVENIGAIYSTNLGNQCNPLSEQSHEKETFVKHVELNSHPQQTTTEPLNIIKEIYTRNSQELPYQSLARYIQAPHHVQRLQNSTKVDIIDHKSCHQSNTEKILTPMLTPPNKTSPCTKVSNDLIKNMLLTANEPYMFQDQHQRDIFTVKSMRMNDYSNKEYSSIFTKNNSPSLRNVGKSLNNHSELLSKQKKEFTIGNRYPINLKKACPQDTLHGRSTSLDTVDQRDLAMAVINTPSIGSNLTNLGAQLAQFPLPLHNNLTMSKHLTSSFENSHTREIIDRENSNISFPSTKKVQFTENACSHQKTRAQEQTANVANIINKINNKTLFPRTTSKIPNFIDNCIVQETKLKKKVAKIIPLNSKVYHQSKIKNSAYIENKPSISVNRLYQDSTELSYSHELPPSYLNYPSWNIYRQGINAGVMNGANSVDYRASSYTTGLNRISDQFYMHDMKQLLFRNEEKQIASHARHTNTIPNPQRGVSEFASLNGESALQKLLTQDIPKHFHTQQFSPVNLHPNQYTQKFAEGMNIVNSIDQRTRPQSTTVKIPDISKENITLEIIANKNSMGAGLGMNSRPCAQINLSVEVNRPQFDNTSTNSVNHFPSIYKNSHLY